jgi:dihydroorotate dehydrogenase (NAD+) catalytic subunit
MQERKERILRQLSGRHRGSDILLGTVSGVATTKLAMVRYADREMPAIGLITTKSFQVTANSGNREPIITEPEYGCFGNSVGLRNPGMDVAYQQLAELGKLRSILNVSVSGSSPEEFIALVRKFAPIADIIELNYSCPHAAAGYGASIGCDPMIAADYTREVRLAVGDECPALIFVKLTPNVPDIGIIAEAVVRAGADGISAINTVGPEQYIQEHAHAPVLQNSLDGRGGKSGLWIRQDALRAVSRIRETVGEHLPIIGMGGVSSAEDAAELMRAGADVVGLGSVFGRVHQQNWVEFTSRVAQKARKILNGEKIEDTTGELLIKERQMAYEPCRITRIVEHEGGVSVIYTDMDNDRRSYKAGEYAFIWLPGVGEKPFSVAGSHPVTFIVKDRGTFTHELVCRSVGDTIYIRGIYGKGIETADTAKAIILAGGTGLAVVPSLAEKLARSGTRMHIYYGTSAEGSVPMEDEIRVFGTLTSVPDNGVPARVIDVMAEQVTEIEDTAAYMIGPEIFMSRASELLQRKGIPAQRIFLSMERPSLCGIGMCGECGCGDRLTCQYGTFVRLDYLKSHAPELLI